MGSSRFSASDHATVSARSYSTRSTDDIFADKIDKTMAPKNIKVRESCDSPLNPNSTPIILALDCTGSMGSVIHVAIAKFGGLIGQIIDRNPVSDPHIMTMMFDDVNFCHDALQVSQFEADIKAVDQFEKMHITGNGGGNNSESYHLPLYMAASKTTIDSMKKRKKKGYLFTVGDENPPPPLTPSQIKEVFGPDEPVNEPLSYKQCWDMASRTYECFHVVVMGNTWAGGQGEDRMRSAWSKEIGQRVIILNDINDLPEVIVSAIQVHEGADVDAVVNSWSDSTALTVRAAVSTLVSGAKPVDGSTTAGIMTA